MDVTQPSGTPVETGADSLVRDLKGIATFKDVPDEGLFWMACHMEVKTYETGDILFREGDAADRLVVLFEGKFQARLENGPDNGSTFTMRAGELNGMLPYSRLKTFPLTARAAERSRAALFPAALFPELLQRYPLLQGRLISLLADRVRSTTKDDELREKLMALGKLSAGLAHELNNPAAAARRAAENLEISMTELRTANLQLDEAGLSSEQRLFLGQLEKSLTQPHRQTETDALERGDAEEEIGTWLNERDVPRAWELAPVLVDAGCDAECLDDLSDQFHDDALASAVTRLAASFTISRLASEILSSTSRISELVKAIKEYSYMDQRPQQEIDLHDGIESTLTMLGHRLKQGVTVVREYDRSLPNIPAFGSELNQVWTNLIDNAIDAMSGKGELRIRTAREHDRALIEIRDNGPGIPKEIQRRIFDAFFTTKPVGKGTGLGLDIVQRIVEKHGGKLDLESEPGDTRFCIRLPLSGAQKGETK